MLFVLIALWTVAIILLVSDPRSRVMRWLSAVAFSGGAGALSAVIDMLVYPYVTEVYNSPAAERILYNLQAGASLFCYYALPYTIIMFGLAYHPLPKLEPFRRWIAVLLLLPIAACLAFTPPYNEYTPITYPIVALWAVPYILIGSALVLTRRIRNPALARSHAIVCLAVLPTVLFNMMMSYVLPSFGLLRMWVYNTWMVAFGVSVFVIGLFTYGFMGVRVLIDRRRLDSTLRAVTSGTSILNHAIKNDVGKLRLFGEKIRAYAEQSGQAELKADIEVVLTTSAHIQQMIRRVHQQTQDLELRKQTTDLGEMAAVTLRTIEPTLGSIQLEADLPQGWQGTVDAAQLKEALNNILSNAIEAIGEEGRITVRLTESKKTIELEITDTGAGMDRKQMRKALEPFYTTKSSGGMNFGLGLPYAYHVVRKHGGHLHIDSKKGQGTSIYISLPKKGIAFERRKGEARGAHNTRLDHRG